MAFYDQSGPVVKPRENLKKSALAGVESFPLLWRQKN